MATIIVHFVTFFVGLYVKNKEKIVIWLKTPNLLVLPLRRFSLFYLTSVLKLNF